jgi:hypothetical protein
MIGLPSVPKWLKEHPHTVGENYGVSDTLYFSSDRLEIDGVDMGLPGAGYFNTVKNSLILTAPGKTRSVWKLPAWMYPSLGKRPLSYHDNAARWEQAGEHTNLTVASRGQEFVLDSAYYDEVFRWLRELFVDS